ncbi:hypothetical protein AB0C33_28960 [Nonomuraea sp. NPDC048881]|uniref:hypothetical protein n=1 Tax=Nonomuraea sp. NPDC048881 TaxID=3155030 RepID=UPI003411A4AD
MTDPITCPECQGRRGVQLGELFLSCTFCGRFCLGSKKVTHIEAGTLVIVPCKCAED